MSELIIAAVKAHSFMIQRRYCISINYANSYPALAMKKVSSILSLESRRRWLETY